MASRSASVPTDISASSAIARTGEFRVAEVAEVGVEALGVHDAHLDDPSFAFGLSRLTDAGVLHRAPIGIFREVDAPAYDDLAREQMDLARGRGAARTTCSRSSTAETPGWSGEPGARPGGAQELCSDGEDRARTGHPLRPGGVRALGRGTAVLAAGAAGRRARDAGPPGHLVTGDLRPAADPWCPRGWWGADRPPAHPVCSAGAAAVVSVNWGVYIWAVNHGHVVETSLGYYINPILSILVGVIFLRERLAPLQWVSVGLAAPPCWC